MAVLPRDVGLCCRKRDSKGKSGRKGEKDGYSGKMHCGSSFLREVVLREETCKDRECYASFRMFVAEERKEMNTLYIFMSR